MNEWKEIWNRRHIEAFSADILQNLIDLDGFDSGAGKLTADVWRQYAGEIARLIGLRKGDSVFEVGCGSGAFLFALREMGAQVAGLDYSAGLIDAARKAMPEGNFCHADAAELTPDPTFDFVIANGVFHYFPDQGYAGDVLARSMKKARRAVAVLEIPDASMREESERTRRSMLSPDEYKKKYQGLAHQYYSGAWFETLAAKMGFQCSIFQQNIAGYAQNPFRMNCIMACKKN